MTHLLRNKSLFLIILPLISLLFLTACDNSVSGDDHDHHSDPVGIVLIMDDVEIARQEGGDIIYHSNGHLHVQEGEETNLINVRWLDEDGDLFLPDTGEGYALGWQIDDEQILDIVQHDSDGTWGFRFTGRAAGHTTVRFRLDHNDHDHFTSLSFEIHVESANEAAAM